MTIIPRPDQSELIDKAIQAGLIKSADEVLDIAVEALRDRLKAGGFARGRDDARPIWEIIVESMKDVPAEDLARLPEDGASQVDHYVYGLPKR
jgi:hypothetical protein